MLQQTVAQPYDRDVGAVSYHADQPPSTTTFAPVTYDDASDARKTTAPSASCGVSIRPSGTRASYASRNSFGWSFHTPARVSVFTRTPLFAQYVARYLVRFRIADFETE